MIGFLDSIFSSSSDKGGIPGYLRKDYEKIGIYPDDEEGSPLANNGKKMYRIMCRRIYKG